MMVLPMRINAFALLFIGVWLVSQRASLERERAQLEQVAPPERLSTVGGA
jgi:hypothetical protein